MTSLKSIILFRADHVTDDGLREFGKASPHLQTLYVQGAPGITDAGLRSLTRSASLHRVSLEGSNVTEAGLRAS